MEPWPTQVANALHKRDTQALKIALLENADGLTDHGGTLILFAVVIRYAEGVRLLLAAGVSPNSALKPSPLKAAIEAGFSEVIPDLIDAGAEL